MRLPLTFTAHPTSPTWRLPIIVFLLTAMVGGWIFFKSESNRREIEMARANQLVSSYATAITRQFDHALSAANALAVMVHQGKGRVAEFSRLSKYMLNMYKGAYALALAPDGVVQQIEPAASNACVNGHDIMAGMDRATLIPTMDQNVVEFYGPIRLLQGPMGAIGKLPVFLKNAEGKAYFWGYTLVTLKFPDAFSDARLEDMESRGYTYRLSGKNPQTDKVELIAASRKPLQGRIFTRQVKVGSDEWTLEVSKKDGWQSGARTLVAAVIVIISSLCMGWFAYVLAAIIRSRRELQSIAQYDALTGLPNRRLLESHLKQAIAGAANGEHQVAVCFLDLDGFKEINDSLGHAAGDYLLQQMSLRLHNCMRASDMLARFGGDEFVVVLNELHSIDECEKILARMIKAAQEAVEIDGKQVVVSASIGVAMYQPGLGRDELMRRADAAMYQAKQLGKNKFVFAD
ncbi:sensor domain-containing diguanylate cyclase [Herminiimonas contaminans]|uniref:Diguanylate cyclase n=1 Tax=Herminiimonas contaminans TaxID=1111140 RepID=A0ABS0EUC8_9BURK|nr:sensor domain-containing diguanylate cyclase [Herminiimonas contaminans]MBF8178440.1 diguanylate cyclase [Herminiimonas contaminans]